MAPSSSPFPHSYSLMMGQDWKDAAEQPASGRPGNQRPRLEPKSGQRKGTRSGGKVFNVLDGIQLRLRPFRSILRVFWFPIPNLRRAFSMLYTMKPMRHCKEARGAFAWSVPLPFILRFLPFANDYRVPHVVGGSLGSSRSDHHDHIAVWAPDRLVNLYRDGGFGSKHPRRCPISISWIWRYSIFTLFLVIETRKERRPSAVRNLTS